MHRLWIVASLLFSACGPSASGGSGQAPSTTTGTPNPSAANDPDMHCTTEVRTGTHMEKKICRSETEREQDRRTAEELYLTPNSRAGRP